MFIKIADIVDHDRGRTGEISNIGIATDKNDIAAEADTSLNAQEYDTDLNYTGAITFGSNWCYFIQIKKVNNKER